MSNFFRRAKQGLGCLYLGIGAWSAYEGVSAVVTFKALSAVLGTSLAITLPVMAFALAAIAFFKGIDLIRNPDPESRPQPPTITI